MNDLNLNQPQKMMCYLYSLSIIGGTMHQLKGLQFKTHLDLNIDHYIIFFHSIVKIWKLLLPNLLNLYKIGHQWECVILGKFHKLN